MDSFKAGLELAAFESAERISRSLPDIQELFSKFKITNCLSRVIEIVNARNATQAIHSITQLLELYDVLWKIPAAVAAVFNNVMYYVLTSIPRMFSEIGDFFKKLTGNYYYDAPEEEVLRNQTAGSFHVATMFEAMLGPKSAALAAVKTFMSAHDNLGVTILGWIGALVLLFGGGSLMLTSTLASRIAKTVSNLGSTIKGLESVGKGFAYISNLVTEQVANILGLEVVKPITPRDQLVSQILAINADFKTTVAEFKSDPTKWLTSIKKIKKLNDSLDQVHKIYEDLARSTDNMASCHSALIELRGNIKQISDFYDNIVNSMVGKVIPTTLYLYGDSGVGKSHVAEYIAQLLRDDEESVSTIYTRNASDQFWSGYEGQNVVLYDDFNQDKENTDHKELIGIYTGASFLPRFAEIKDKGKPYSSPYLILCSNNGVVESSKVINTVLALDRRRDLVFHVRNPAYEAMLAKNETKDKRQTCFKKDYSHLTFTEMIDTRNKTGGLDPVVVGARNNIHLIVATLKKIHRERTAEFKARVEEKMAAIKAGTFQYFDPQVQALLQEATRRISTMESPKGAVHVARLSASSVQSDDSEVSLTDAQRQALEEYEAEIALRPGQGQLIRGQEQLRNQVRQSFERKPPILLMGPPGIGKTKFLEVANGPVFDEFPQSKELFLEVVDYVWLCYEGKEEQAILTCNDVTLDAMFETCFPGDYQKKQAFLRRCEIFRFSFNTKSYIWRTQYNIEDLQSGLSYDDIVTIEYTSTTQKKKIVPKNILEKYLNQGIVVKQEVQRSKTLDTLDVVCEIEIGINLSREEVEKPDFSMALTDIPKLMKVFKGEPHKFLHRIVEITSLFGKKVGTLHDAMISFNDLERDPQGLPSIGITFSDETRFILVTNKQNKLEIFKAPHIYKEINLSEDEARKLSLERLKNENPTNFIFFQFLDLIGFVLKVGTVFYTLYDHGKSQQIFKRDTERRQIRREEFNAKLKNEGYDYDDIDEMFDDYERYMARPHPKSYLNTNRKDKYCSIHHTVDRCYLLESEASRRPIHMAYNEDLRRVKHDDGTSFLESGQEFKDVHRKKQQPVIVEESGLEFKDVHRKQHIPKIVEEQVETIRGKKVKSGIVAETKNGKTDFLVPESALDPGAIMQGHVIFKNSLMAQKGGMTFNRVLMLKGHIGVINNHAVPNKNTFDVFDGNNTWEATIFYRNENKDIAFFKLPPQSQQYGNITGYLNSRDKLKSVMWKHGILITPYREKNTPPFASWKSIMFRDAVERAIEGKQRYGINYAGHSLGITYDSSPIGTQPGDCGSALILNDPQCAQKLLGIHGAGSIHYGFGSIITQQDVEDAERTLNQETKDVPIKILKHQCISDEVEGTLLGMEVFGLMSKDGVVLKQFVPETTKYHDSPFKFDEKFGHMFEPAVMSPRDTRCTEGARPYMDAISKWNNPQPEIDENLLEIATNEIGNHLAQIIKSSGYKVSVLTKTEAINGVCGVPGSNPIYRQSSAGFPWKHLQNVQRKSAFFCLNEKTLLHEITKEEPGKSLNHAIDSLISCAKEGYRPATVFCSALKDEPLKLKKIYDATKTRTFAASPVDYTIASRMYFHGVAGALTSLFHKTPIKIGINPAGTDFHDLYLYHAEVSTAGFDGDFANWDGTIPKAFMEKAGEIYNIIYQECDQTWKPEDDVIRRNLHACVEGPLLNYKEFVIKCPGGNPSGQPQTTLDNCLCNYLLGYYVFAKVMKKADKDWSFSNFLKTVRPSYFGDDNMYTVDSETIGTFNFVTFKEEAEKIGFTLTNAAKDGKVARFIRLQDMEFLKRNFTKIDGRWFGALVDASICKMLSYAKHKAHFYHQDIGKVDYDRSTIEDTIQGCLLECALKGEEFYNEIAEHLKKKCAEYHFEKHIPTYQSAKVQALYEGASSLLDKFTTDLSNQSKELKFFKLSREDPDTGIVEEIIVNKGSCCLPLLDVVKDEDDNVDKKLTKKSENNWIHANMIEQKHKEKLFKKMLRVNIEGELVAYMDEIAEDEADFDDYVKDFIDGYGMTRAQILTHVGLGLATPLKNQSKQPHIILGVPECATEEEIKAAYKRKARTCHPDKGGSKKDFQELSEAYQAMLNFKTGSYTRYKTADELWEEFFGGLNLDEAINDFLGLAKDATLDDAIKDFLSDPHGLVQNEAIDIVQGDPDFAASTKQRQEEEFENEDGDYDFTDGSDCYEDCSTEGDSDQEEAMKAYEESQRKKTTILNPNAPCFEPLKEFDEQELEELEKQVFVEEEIQVEIHPLDQFKEIAIKQDEERYRDFIEFNGYCSESLSEEQIRANENLLIFQRELLHPDAVHFERQYTKSRREVRQSLERILAKRINLFSSITVATIHLEDQDSHLLQYFTKPQRPQTPEDLGGGYTRENVKLDLFFFYNLRPVVNRVKDGCTSNNSSGGGSTDDRRLDSGESNEDIRIGSTPAITRGGSSGTWNTDQRCGPILEDSVCNRLDTPVDGSDESWYDSLLKAYPSKLPESDSFLPNQAVQLLERESRIQDVPSRDRLQCREDRNIQTTAQSQTRRNWRYRRVVSPPIRGNGRENDGGFYTSGFRPNKRYVSLQSSKLGRCINFWWILCYCCFDEAGREATRRFNKLDDREQAGRRFYSRANIAAKTFLGSWKCSKAIQRALSSTSRGSPSPSGTSESGVYESSSGSSNVIYERYVRRIESPESSSKSYRCSPEIGSYENGSVENETTNECRLLQTVNNEQSLLDDRCRAGSRSRQFGFNTLHNIWNYGLDSTVRRIASRIKKYCHKLRPVRPDTVFKPSVRKCEPESFCSNTRQWSFVRHIQRRKPSGVQCVQHNQRVRFVADESEHRGAINFEPISGNERLSTVSSVRNSNRATNYATETVPRGVFHYYCKCLDFVAFIQKLQNRASWRNKQDSTNTKLVDCSKQSQSERNDSNERNPADIKAKRAEDKATRTHRQRNKRGLKLVIKPSGPVQRVGAFVSTYRWLKGVLGSLKPQYDPNNPNHFKFPFWWPVETPYITASIRRKFGLKKAIMHVNLKNFNLTFPKVIQNGYESIKQSMATISAIAARSAGYKKLINDTDSYIFNSNVNSPKDLVRRDAAIGSRNTAPTGGFRTVSKFSSHSVGGAVASRRDSVPGFRAGGPTRIQLPGSHTTSSSTDNFSSLSTDRGNTNGGVYSVTSGIPFDAGSSRTYRSNRTTANSFVQAGPPTTTRGAQISPNTRSQGNQTQPDAGGEKAKGGHTAGALAAGAVAGHVTATAISSGVGARTAKQLQSSRQEWATNFLNTKKSAYEAAGLPSYMAYGDHSSSPSQHTGQVAAGKSVYMGHVPGNSQSSAYTGSNAQVANGWGNILN